MCERGRDGDGERGSERMRECRHPLRAREGERERARAIVRERVRECVSEQECVCERERDRV